MSGLWIVLDYEQPGLSPPRTRGSRRWLPQHAWLNGTVLVVERPGSPTHVARELRGMAETEERRNPLVDWSLRTSPQGWRWSSGPS